MPNPRNCLYDDQWEVCQRCGKRYPMHQLQMQEGSLRCVRSCIVNLEIKRRSSIIARVLSDQATQTEGMDWRWVDKAWDQGQFEDEVF